MEQRKGREDMGPHENSPEDSALQLEGVGSGEPKEASGVRL